jgi:hypothetical protein
MYLTKRRNPSNPFRKDKKYEACIKSRHKSLPLILPEETDTKKTDTKKTETNHNHIYTSYTYRLNIWGEEYITQRVLVEENQQKIENQPKKLYKKKGKSITYEVFAKFKLEQRYNTLMKNLGDKFLILSEYIVQNILEFIGTVSTHNDYQLMKLGFHENERKTRIQIKRYLIRQISECSDEHFITIMKYLKDCSLSEPLIQRIKYLLNIIESYELMPYFNNREEFIHFEVKWERQKKTYHTGTIIKHIIREPNENITKNLIENLPK